MPTARLYHNADCSKCRAALAMLLERGIDVEVVSYLEHPPSREELRRLVDLLGLPASALLRDAGGDAGSVAAGSLRDDEAVLDALVADPTRLQRPILVIGQRAVIARPPERVLELV